MSLIKYKLVQKAQPGIAGGGTRKYYASITQRNQITLKELSTASYVKVNNGVH